MRLAYCTGIFRTAWVTSTTATMLSRTTPRSRRNCHHCTSPTFRSRSVCVVWLGNRATIPPKMISETPLPTPYSVMISPSQVNSIVPAVSVITIMPIVSGRVSGSAPRFRMRMVCPEAIRPASMLNHLGATAGFLDRRHRRLAERVRLDRQGSVQRACPQNFYRPALDETGLEELPRRHLGVGGKPVQGFQIDRSVLQPSQPARVTDSSGTHASPEGQALGQNGLTTFKPWTGSCPRAGRLAFPSSAAVRATAGAPAPAPASAPAARSASRLQLVDLHNCRRTPATSSTGRPLVLATSSGVRRSSKAARVARAWLIGFRDPRDLVRMSLIPAASSTARTDPPAMTPVPSDAGRNSTFDALKYPMTSWGIVVLRSGISINCFFASSTAFRMASGTSAAFPSPTPARPCSSPTTTSAAKLNRFAPFVTFATRLIHTAFSTVRFTEAGSILFTGIAVAPQNSRPAFLAASASALIRPWYL